MGVDCSPPLADVTYYHTLNGLRQQKPGPKWVSWGKIKVFTGLHSFWRLQGRICWSFLASRGCVCMPWLLAPSMVKASNGQRSPLSPHQSDPDSSSTSSLPWEGRCPYPGPTWLTQPAAASRSANEQASFPLAA